MAVSSSYSIRAVLKRLSLVPAGGNYAQVTARITELKISTSHFRGRAWNKGLKYHTPLRPELDEMLVENSSAQSHKLKNRLFEAGLKRPACELCGWAETLAGKL